ncbi:hypothetical protein QFZ22_004903 [Streptomyces canus]|uniref:DUF4397 domain-containing protein n=1 Tax=Streptomyces canus TaxID=58343 RepID=A0AAW8FJF3_9ACTN|nr:hypothetical protein [Streptomyces canus]MDQ0908918.1 hypothetical protein [Streptomyces canus]
MTNVSRPARALAAASLAVLSLAGCAADVAQAAPAHSDAATRVHGPHPVDVLLANKQLDVPGRLSAGTITFNFRTTDTKGHTVLLVRLKDGATVKDYLAQLATISHDPAHAAEAARTAADEAENLGGAVVDQSAPESFTTVLSAGTYHLLDFSSVGVSDPDPAVTSFQVTGHTRHAAVPAPDAVIVQADVDGKARYVVPDHLPADGTVLVTNESSAGEEATLTPVEPGTTDADLAAYFASFATGTQVANPFTGPTVGMPVMSPGRQGLMHYAIPAGTYALASYAVDPANGRRRAAEGMATVVTVR